MSFACYLTFTGNCREAMTHYAGIFGAADLQIMGFGDAPEGQAPAGAGNRVMHSQFSAGPGAPLMGADLPEGMAARGGQATVFHAAPTLERAQEIFAALAQGGRVDFPFQATFWSPGFGGLTDQFGTAWMITVAPGGA